MSNVQNSPSPVITSQNYLTNSSNLQNITPITQQVVTSQAYDEQVANLQKQNAMLIAQNNAHKRDESEFVTRVNKLLNEIERLNKAIVVKDGELKQSQLYITELQNIKSSQILQIQQLTERVNSSGNSSELLAQVAKQQEEIDTLITINNNLRNNNLETDQWRVRFNEQEALAQQYKRDLEQLRANQTDAVEVNYLKNTVSELRAQIRTLESQPSKVVVNNQQSEDALMKVVLLSSEVDRLRNEKSSEPISHQQVTTTYNRVVEPAVSNTIEVRKQTAVHSHVVNNDPIPSPSYQPGQNVIKAYNPESPANKTTYQNGAATTVTYSNYNLENVAHSTESKTSNTYRSTNTYEQPKSSVTYSRRVVQGNTYQN